MFDPAQISALVGSRICHDLISPIGAIGNGVELMMMDASGTTSQEMSLIMESTAAANARIRFFRVAFGQCSSEQQVGRSEAVAVVRDQFMGGRVSVDWESGANLPRRDVKLAYLALMCCESALPQGGKIHVQQGDSGWSVVAQAARFRMEPALWGGLSDPDLHQDITPSQVHFPLFAIEAARQHRKIIHMASETELRVSF